jgi:release factor glutamine methyltransferase
MREEMVAKDAPRKLMDYLQLATQYFADKGLSSPRLDAEVLLAAVLGVDRIQIYTQFDRPLHGEEVDRYRSFLSRRADKEPVAYIIGQKEFLGHPFAVDARALIPRPETELLVEQVMAYAETSPLSWLRHRVLEIGTGSGCIGASLALEIGIPEALVLTDISAEALQLARHNLDSLGLTDKRIDLRQGDLWQPVAQQRFHLILANPPYIDPQSRDLLMPDVASYEPELALFSDDHGRRLSQRLIAEGRGYLYGEGRLFMEINEKDAEYWQDYATKQGWSSVHITKDLAGKPRLLQLQREPES